MKYQSAFVTFRKQKVNGVRAQVKAETGTLPVKAIQDLGNGDMKKVIFDVSAVGNGKLKRDPYANINKNEAAFAECEKALESGEPVTFRIEMQRKRSVKELKTPMCELDAASQTVRCLVAVNDVITSEAQSDPADDAEWREVAAGEAPAYLSDEDASPASVDEARARDIYDRVCASQGTDSQAAIAVGAVLAIFGIDVYGPRR